MKANQLPAQLYYKIGQVSRHTGVKPHVLRYWEAEFGLIAPRKDKYGQRLYRRQDIETILRIKGLLYQQRYSIEGAKKRLKQELSPGERSIPDDIRAAIAEHKKSIQELLALLNPGE